MALNATIKELMENRAFMEKAIEIRDIDELAELFAANGVNAPMTEISAAIEEYVKTFSTADTEFNADDLEAVAGGRDNPVAIAVFSGIALIWNMTIGPLTGTRMVQRGSTASR